MKTKIIVLLLSLFWNLSCSQNTTNYQEIRKEIETAVPVPPEKQPVYYAPVYSSNCRWEVRVNDVLLWNFAAKIGDITNVDIPLNFNILNTGKQKIQIKIFPLEGSEKLGEYATFRIRGEHYPDKRNLEKYNSFLSFELPREQTKDLPYFEKTFEFDAQVPYQLVGWTKSKDLSKVPDLEQKVLKKLNELKAGIEKYDDALYLNAIKKRETEKYICFYATKKAIEEDVEESLFKNFFDDSYDIKFLPIKNYQLILQGNNRVVELRMQGKQLDPWGVPFTGKYKDDHSEYEGSFDFRFHIPEGSEELEVIR
ncbi:hypothetical protein ETU09_06040 [Apibacter muscae]|uniref:Lipoprotein n=1 Tax=Apibacter muscae TaxID=2509004 RepID=A0A563DEU1_9FLAO|nr:hypothetical protein [Apibacter muscae]TWP28481.1 hypothetical protein ETU09_06040 [Apibacter muscae]